MHDVWLVPGFGTQSLLISAVKNKSAARERRLTQAYVELRHTSVIFGSTVEMYEDREVMCAQIDDATRILYTHMVSGAITRVLVHYFGL